MAEINRLNALVNADLPTKSQLGLTIANSYHPHRYKAAALGKRSPVQAFADDRLLKRAIELQLDSGGIGDSLSVLSIVSWTQGVSNFRPSYAAYICKKYCRKSLARCWTFPQDTAVASSALSLRERWECTSA